MNTNRQQAQLLDSYLEALQRDPNARPPAELDADLARFAQRIVTTQTAPAAGAKERVRQRLRTHLRLTNAAHHNAQHTRMGRREQRMKNDHKQKRIPTPIPLTLVATLILVVGIGIGVFLASQPGEQTVPASDPIPMVITETPAPTQTGTSTMTPTATWTITPSQTFTPTFTFTPTVTFTSTPTIVPTSTPILIQDDQVFTLEPTVLSPATQIIPTAISVFDTATCTIRVPDSLTVNLRQGPSLDTQIVSPLVPGMDLEVVGRSDLSESVSWYRVRVAGALDYPVGWVVALDEFDISDCTDIQDLSICNAQFVVLTTAQRIYEQGEPIILRGYAKADDFNSARIELRGVATNNAWVVIDSLEQPVPGERDLSRFDTALVSAGRYEIRLAVYDSLGQLLAACAVTVDITSA